MSAFLNLQHRIWALSTIALVTLLLINGLQSYRSINELNLNEQRASNTQSILRAIKDVFSSVQDAELGLRGYLISGDPDHLKPYFESLESIQRHIQNLEKLHTELPDQELRLSELKKLIKERLRNLTDDINETSINSNSEWLADHNMNESHKSMLKLSHLIRDMETTEYRLLELQSLESKQSRSKALFTIAVANSALFLLILIISILIKRGIDRQRAEAELLELKVNQRTYELQHFSNELKRSNRELQDFAFVASHDLQEPLRKIRAFGDRLYSRFGDKLGEDGNDYIKRMQKAAERMSNLIGDLLEFSRVSTRNDPFQTVDLNLVLQEVLENLEVNIEEQQAIVEAETLPSIEADSTQMKQLFQNILSNALKFVSPNTSPIIKITVQESKIPFVVPETQQYEIAIKDNGIGFDEKYLEKIFTPFQRLHGKHEYVGTGIGLSICRRIVERHHGELSATSKVNEGTTFLIILPAAQSAIATNQLDEDDLEV